ncbi:hypothetical protein ACWDSJ_36975 [Nocardia sp. NPDC003482]
MTSRVVAGWATISKPPGSYDEYSVLASSRGPYTVKQLGAIIRRSPGNSPPLHDPPPAGLPWVWFTPVRAKGTEQVYLGIVIRSWTDNVDAARRRIVTNRFFCVPIDDFLRAGCGFVDLYDAVVAAEPLVDDADPLRSSAFELSLQSSGACREAGQPDADLFVQAAAALLDGPVAIVEKTIDVRDRLILLDSVARWLPAGARAWLSASIWADSGANHGMALTFTAAGKADDVILDPTKPMLSGRPLSSPASRYAQSLRRLRQIHGPDAVLAHLATLVTTNNRDAETVSRDLEDLDLASIVLADARTRSLRPSLVLRLHENGNLSRLPQGERREIMSALLDSADIRQLHELQEVLRHQRKDCSDEDLTGAMIRALEADSTDGTLRWLGPFASKIDATVQGAVAIGEADRRRLGVFGSDIPVAALINITRQDQSWWQPLARIVVESPRLTRRIAKLLFVNSSETDRDWMYALNEAGASASPWGRLSDVFYRGLRVRSDPLLAEDVAHWWRTDPDIVRALLEAARKRLSATDFDALLGSVLPVLYDVEPEYRGTDPPLRALLALLRQPLQCNDIQQVWIDFTLYRYGERVRPRFDSWQYRQGVLQISGRDDWSQVQRDRFISFVATTLGVGWTGQADSILPMLWELIHPRGSSVTGKASVLRAVCTEISHSNGQLLDAPDLRRWQPLLAQPDVLDVKTRNIMNLRQLLASDASVEEVATAIAQYVSSGALPEEIAPAVRSPWWFAAPDRAFHVASRTTALLSRRTRHPRPYAPGLELLRAYLDRRLGSVESDHDRRLVADAAAQLELVVRALLLAADRTPGRDEPAILETPLPRLFGQVSETLKKFQQQSRDGRSWLRRAIGG